MQKTKEQAQIESLAKEALAIGKSMAEDLGIVAAIPPEVKEVKVEYSPFAKKESYGRCRKITPFRVGSVMRVQHPETAEEVEKFKNAHTYTDCKLISCSKVGMAEDTEDLSFYSNATKWDPVTFWHIPKDIPISVPNWVIEHINQTCNLRVLESEPLNPEEMHRNVKNQGMCSSGRYINREGKQIFRFVELSA
jgi:hypothetical protein